MQIVTLDPEIKTVGDLAGKTVSIGAVGSGVYFNAIDVLGAYDLTEDDISPVYQNFDDSVESLQDGRIDAAFIVAGAPTTSIVQLATTQEVHLVSLDQEHIDKLIEVSPYYSAYTISADVYGTAEDWHHRRHQRRADRPRGPRPRRGLHHRLHALPERGQDQPRQGCRAEP